jgi:hypothetical protein
LGCLHNLLEKLLAVYKGLYFETESIRFRTKKLYSQVTRHPQMDVDRANRDFAVSASDRPAGDSEPCVYGK